MSNKEGQHFVSRFYLKGFQDSTAPGEVWLHKLGKTPRRFSTRAICKRPWYYSLKNEDGTWDSSIEDFLGKFVESPTATVLNKEIDHKSVPSEAGKQYLAIFLAFLMLRGPGFREMNTAAFSAVSTQMLEMKSKDDPQLKEALDAYKRGDITLELDNRYHVQTMMKGAQPIAMALCDKKFSFLQTTPERPFITSDRALAMDAIGGPRFPHFSGIGVGMKNTRIFFPLRADVLLILSGDDSHREGWFNARGVEVAEANTIIAQQSGDFVISSQRDIRLPAKYGGFKTFSIN